MVVIVKDKVPTWAVIFAIVLVIVAVAVVVFAITGGKGTVLVVAIPGFPAESIVIGLIVGFLALVLKHRSEKSTA